MHFCVFYNLLLLLFSSLFLVPTLKRNGEEDEKKERERREEPVLQVEAEPRIPQSLLSPLFLPRMRAAARFLLFSKQVPVLLLFFLTHLSVCVCVRACTSACQIRNICRVFFFTLPLFPTAVSPLPERTHLSRKHFLLLLRGAGNYRRKKQQKEDKSEKKEKKEQKKRERESGTFQVSPSCFENFTWLTSDVAGAASAPSFLPLRQVRTRLGSVRVRHAAGLSGEEGERFAREAELERTPGPQAGGRLHPR